MANLFYVIGASGAGKDSLLSYVREHLDHNANAIFAHRYITRPADAGGENHVAISEEEFVQRKQRRCFAMSWYSHATYYGIGVEINHWLSQGLDVVMNGSRAFLSQAAQLYHELVPVLITVEAEVLRSRLEARGRETAAQIEERLFQAVKLEQGLYHPRLIRVENNGAIEEAGEQLLKAICGHKKSKCA